LAILIPVNGNGSAQQLRQIAEAFAARRPKALHALFVDEVPDDPFYLAVHKIADRLTPKMRDAFLRGVLAMNGAIDELALIAAVETGQFDLAMAAIPFEPFADSLKTGGGEILLKALSEMGVLAASALQDTHGLTIAFDLTNPRAQVFAATQTATMVTEVTDATKESIRGIIQRGFSEHMTPQDVAKEIKQVVGLHSRQAQAVVNFRDRLVADGVEGELLEKRVEKYAAAQLRHRAETIARTELMSASNAGQHELWSQAQEKGLLPHDQKRVWIATPDDRIDMECEALDGKETGLNEPFSGGVMEPPLHPSCRCTTGLTRS
jgi:SPP1 gp7 family putative phage head morphogenesis protein